MCFDCRRIVKMISVLDKTNTLPTFYTSFFFRTQNMNWHVFFERKNKTHRSSTLPYSFFIAWKRPPVSMINILNAIVDASYKREKKYLKCKRLHFDVDWAVAGAMTWNFFMLLNEYFVCAPFFFVSFRRRSNNWRSFSVKTKRGEKLTVKCK